ncbi:hypothetical protein [Achromobacter marplatensis]|uniref:hypothetical protein n=1 Tax=Achromobacter marplatensis TaxID=470868 RepID=UPI0039F6CF1B
MRLFLVLGLLLLGILAAVGYRFRRPRPDDTRRRIVSDLVAGGIMYAFVAPAVGGVALMIGVAIVTLEGQNLITAIFGLPWFYVFGIVPALLCGIVAGALKPVRPTWPALGMMTGVGALCGFLFLSGFGSREFQWTELLFPFVVGALPGMVGAFLCTVWFYGWPGRGRASTVDTANTADTVSTANTASDAASDRPQ